MTRALRVVLCTSVFAAAAPAARAQTYVDIGIRAQGMAGAFVAVADDATATWWNPAGLAGMRSFVDVTVEGAEGGNAGVALTLPSLGLSYYRLRISQIPSFSSTAEQPSSRIEDHGIVGTDLSNADPFSLHQFGATVGQSIGNHLVVGSTVKLVRALDETHVGLDLGAMAALGVLRLGASVRDVTQPTFGGDTFLLDREARAGAAIVTTSRGLVDRLTLSVDADLISTRFGERAIAGGAEVWLVGGRLGLRAGGSGDTEGDGGTFGAVGISGKVWSHLTIDAALSGASNSHPQRWGVDLRVTY